jgi:hypothetical protein
MFRGWFQNGIHASEVYYQRAAFCCVFYGQNDSMQRIFIKKCFLLTVGSVCHVNRFTTGSRIVENASLMTKWLNRGDNSQRLTCCRFQRTGKSSISTLVEDMSRNKCFSPVRISHVLRFISICDLFTDSPS